MSLPNLLTGCMQNNAVREKEQVISSLSWEFLFQWRRVPCWAGGHWVGIGEACRNGGPPRKQAQATNLNGFWEMKRGKRYTERAVAQDGAGGSPRISSIATVI